MVPSPTRHGEATCVTDGGKLRSLLSHRVSTIFCIRVLRDYQVICYNYVCVPTSGVSGKTCCRDGSISNALFSTLHMVYTNHSARPLLPLTLLRVDVLWKEPVVNRRSQNVLYCVQLCICKTGCSRNIQHSDFRMTSNNPCAPSSYHVRFKVSSWEHN
ncbi:hypothetical protein D3C79_814240 [compost metagenome]